MDQAMLWAVTVLESYLLGTVLAADVVTRALGHPDPRTLGFGNPGTANMTTTLGPKAGALTLLGDILKTVAAVLVGRLLLPTASWEVLVLVAGTACTLGHCFPVWNGFRGGKGVACLCATMVLANPALGLLALACGFVALVVSSYLSVAGVVMALAFAVALMLAGAPGVAAACAWVQVAIAVWAHGPFLLQIPQGTAPRTDVRAKLRKRR